MFRDVIRKHRRVLCLFAGVVTCSGCSSHCTELAPVAALHLPLGLLLAKEGSAHRVSSVLANRSAQASGESEASVASQLREARVSERAHDARVARCRAW